MKISVVSPVYMTSPMLEKLVDEIQSAVKDTGDELEIILVNDASPDDAWERIQKICVEHNNVKALNLSRNFGQHAAILAGLNYSSGDVTVVMDSDLQDDPAYIPELIKRYKDGFDIVYTKKKYRKHSFYKNISAFFFNLIFNFLSDNKLVQGEGNIGSYSLISRKVTESFKNFNDYQFHYLQVLKWMGFQSTEIEIEHRNRKEGKSSYTLSKMISHAMVAILYHSDKLLKINILVGLMFALFSFVFGLYILITTFLYGYQAGWPSLIVVILFSTGVILMSIGVVGLYVAKAFEQSKNRPKFIVSKTINL